MEQLQAVRSGRWKLHLPLAAKWQNFRGAAKASQAELYDLDADPGEAHNVAAAHPDVVARLAALADKARRDLGDLNQPGRNQRPAGWVEDPQPQLMKETP
jgi:arylsulfatase A-like enzyme